MKGEQTITNLKEVKEMVKIPVYSKIKKVNGQIIGLVDDFVDFPAELLKEIEKEENGK
ncbi:hypothetical protein [Caldibacillus phage CBP1]|uniref:Uncharacterized protein n=1 Tax=Caldibacillus debilis GB1 TaxID=1339248 RepID=A0A420VIL8_9BACI|nr:hypothetical protein [Caldibacillus debilis]ATB52693.1 hypothetical protein [Caldibacillus phage CBP1]RKO63522.1 hypothetical protein Cdeb_02785 [Caldibacillus debilis GB1]